LPNQESIKFLEEAARVKSKNNLDEDYTGIMSFDSPDLYKII